MWHCSTASGTFAAVQWCNGAVVQWCNGAYRHGIYQLGWVLLTSNDEQLIACAGLCSGEWYHHVRAHCVHAMLHFVFIFLKFFFTFPTYHIPSRISCLLLHQHREQVLGERVVRLLIKCHGQYRVLLGRSPTSVYPGPILVPDRLLPLLPPALTLSGALLGKCDEIMDHVAQYQGGRALGFSSSA